MMIRPCEAGCFTIYAKRCLQKRPWLLYNLHNIATIKTKKQQQI
jgi:hypothetical protein